MSSLFKMMVWFCVIILLVPIAVATPNGEQPPSKHMDRDVETATATVLMICAFPMVLFPPTSPFFALGGMLTVSALYLIYDSTTP